MKFSLVTISKIALIKIFSHAIFAFDQKGNLKQVHVPFSNAGHVLKRASNSYARNQTS